MPISITKVAPATAGGPPFNTIVEATTSRPFATSTGVPFKSSLNSTRTDPSPSQAPVMRVLERTRAAWGRGKMKKFFVLVVVALLVSAPAPSNADAWRGHGRVFVGTHVFIRGPFWGGCCWGRPWWGRARRQPPEGGGAAPGAGAAGPTGSGRDRRQSWRCRRHRGRRRWPTPRLSAPGRAVPSPARQVSGSARSHDSSVKSKCNA